MSILLCSVFIAALTAATFGKDGVSNSYAKYALPQSMHQDLEHYIDVSFFIRTRKPAGVIFSLLNSSSSVDKQTAVVAELVGNGLKVMVQNGSMLQSETSSGSLADGDQHFIRIVRNYSLLIIELDNSKSMYSIKFQLILAADVMFVGGIPSSSSSNRRRRDTTSDNSFSGTLQDVRINGAVAEFFPQNGSADVGNLTMTPTVLSNVASGEQTDDICGTADLCQNGGFCYNVFFNDYGSGS